MKARIENTKDFYNTAVKWWNLHKFPPVHASVLPRKVFVVSNEHGDLYSMFVYETDSTLLYLAYPISNLDVEKKHRKGAFEFLLKEIEIWAKKENYFLLYTTSPIKPVHDALQNSGFVYGDIIVTQYFKAIL